MCLGMDCVVNFSLRAVIPRPVLRRRHGVSVLAVSLAMHRKIQYWQIHVTSNDDFDGNFVPNYCGVPVDNTEGDISVSLEV